MARPTHELPEETGPSAPETFLHAGITALLLGGRRPSRPPQRRGADTAADECRAEWRNKQPGMAYRRLGRTGLMVSEVVCGGDPITLENYKHLERALEMGPELPRHGPRLQRRRHRARLRQAPGRPRRRGGTRSS